MDEGSPDVRSVLGEIDDCRRRIETYLGVDNEVDVAELSEKCKRSTEDSQRVRERIVSFDQNTRVEAINDISSATAELQMIVAELRDVDFGLRIFQIFIECDKQLERYEEAKNGSDLNGVVLALSVVAGLLDDCDADVEKLSLYKKIKADLVVFRERLSSRLSESWREIVSWSETSASDTETVVIKIKNVHESKSTLDALMLTGRIDVELNKFSSFLYERVLIPIIRNVVNVQTYEDTHRCLKIDYLPGDRSKPHYEDVLTDLKTVFEYIYLNLDGDNLSRKIGDSIGNDFGDALIRDCLDRTIPNCISELQDYGKVTSQVEIFQKYLFSVNFFESDDFSILNYTNNIDFLFADKTSRRFLENARVIAKKDLENVMSVGCEARRDDDDVVKNDSDSEDRELLQYFFRSFRSSPFRFPRCAVSRSAQELIDLVVLMMEQAVEASDLCARRLYYAARNVFELYMAIVPLHHKRLLETMPQQIALFHNNCMYLAHHLLVLGPKWQKSLDGRRLSYSIAFCDQVKEFRDLGTHVLLTHMRAQRKQLLDTLRSSDLYYIATKDVLSENAEKAVRQCIRQLQVLKTVWSGIFPTDVYTELITCLADTLVEELVSKVVSQEDITADVASQLTDLYRIVLNRLPQIYNDESTVESNINSWLKFKELILVIGGNLATIEERWSNGGGPLALQFKPEEIKRLIRALFQNTTFRASLLSKIK